MKRSFTPLLILTLIFGLFAGCATTPREQYGQAQDSFIAAVTIVKAAHDAGDIDEETWEFVIKPAIRLGDQALDAYNAATAAGETGQDSFNIFRLALRELRPFVVAYVARDD